MSNIDELLFKQFILNNIYYGDIVHEGTPENLANEIISFINSPSTVDMLNTTMTEGAPVNRKQPVTYH